MNDARRGRSFRAHGRVQGVGFRWFVRDAALRTGVAGWVRNEPDGSVSIWTEGSAQALERFEQVLRNAPPPILVDRLIAVDEPPLGSEGFTIRF